jgi:hypothetical protein
MHNRKPDPILYFLTASLTLFCSSETKLMTVTCTGSAGLHVNKEKTK